MFLQVLPEPILGFYQTRPDMQMKLTGFFKKEVNACFPGIQKVLKF